MPQSVDGDIRLSASFELNTNNVKAQAQQLKKSLDDILTSGSTKGNPQLEKMTTQLQKSYLNIEKLQKKLQDAQNERILTPEMASLKSEYKKIGTEIENIIRKQDKMKALGTDTDQYGNMTAGWEKLNAELNLAYKKEAEIVQKTNELLATGKAFTLGDPAKISAITQQLSFATQNGEQLKNKFDGVKEKAEKAASGSAKIAAVLKGAGTAAKVFAAVAKTAFNGIKKAISGITSAIGKVKAGFSKLKDSAKNAFHHVSKDATSGLKKLLRYGLGIRGLFMLFRKLRGYASDAFKGIAQQSSSFNKTMSNITNTFGQFKGSIGTALQPLITIVEPILIRIMNLFINAANAVGSFFATLTGQKYIYKAVKANNSYADSVSGTGKAAKEARKELAAYDKLMVISSQDAADAAGGGGGAGGGFTEELIDPTNSVSKFAQDLKDAWENEDFAAIGELVAGKINEVVGRIDEAIKWENVGPKIEEFMQHWGTAFNSLIDNVDWNLIGKTVGDGLNTITYTVQSFLDNFNLDDLGDKFAQAFNSLNSTVDWPAIGKVVSSGLNEITSAVNQFASNTDWKALGEDVASMFDNLLDNLNADALGSALAAPLESITEYINGFLLKFDKEGTWSTYGEKIATVINSWFSSINWKMIGSNITMGVDGIVEALGKLFDETNWKDIGKDLGEVLNGVINIDWSSVGETLSGGASGLFDAFNSLLTTVNWQQLGKDVVDLFFGIDWKKLFGQAGETLSNIITSAIDWLIGIIKKFNFYDVIKTLVGSIVSFFANINWSDFTSKIMEFVGSLVGNIISSLVNFAIDVGEFAYNLVNSIIDWFKNKKAEWDEAGISIWEGIFQGIGNAIKNIATWIKEKILDPFIKGFKDAFGIHSPSTVMKELGGYLIDGLKEGLSNIWESIKGKFTEMLGKIKDWFVEKKADLVKAWDSFKSGIGEVVTNLKAKVEESFTKAKEAWENFKDKLATLTAEAKEKVKDALANLKSGWESIKDKTSTLIADAKEKVSGAIDGLKAGWDAIKTKTAELWADAKEKTANALSNIKKGWDNVVAGTKELIADAKEKTSGALNTLKSGWDAIKTKAAELTAEAKEKTTGALAELKSNWDAIKNKAVKITAALGSKVQQTAQGWWKKIKGWFKSGDTYKADGGKLQVGAAQTTDKKKVESWWTTFKNWWGTKKLGVEGSLKITAAEMGKGVTVKGNAIVDLKGHTSGSGGNYTMATGGIVRRRLDNVTLGENGPEAVIPLKNNTQWLDIVSKYVVQHMNLGKLDIPHLAQGSVIPPNREFLAVLGDQKSGVNVETPLATIEKALENVMKRQGSSAPIILQLDGKQIAKVVWNESDKRYKQTGKSFA